MVQVTQYSESLCGDDSGRKPGCSPECRACRRLPRSRSTNHVFCPVCTFVWMEHFGRQRLSVLALWRRAPCPSFHPRNVSDGIYHFKRFPRFLKPRPRFDYPFVHDKLVRESSQDVGALNLHSLIELLHFFLARCCTIKAQLRLLTLDI
jgi:hypothetical protein